MLSGTDPFTFMDPFPTPSSANLRPNLPSRREGGGGGGGGIYPVLGALVGATRGVGGGGGGGGI